MQVKVPPARVSWLSKFGTAHQGQVVWATSLLNYPTSNLAMYLPLLFDEMDVIVRGFWYSNGAGTTGNVDLGLYRASDGARIVSTGSTARGTGGTAPLITLANPIWVPRGSYYLAFAQDSSGGSGSANVSSSPLAGEGQMAGFRQEANAFSLPSVMTPAAWSGTVVPLCGLDTRWP